MTGPDDPRLVPLRKLIADTARDLNGTVLPEHGPLGCPLIADLDDEAAERIADAVLRHVDRDRDGPEPAPAGDDRWFIALNGGLHYGVKISHPGGITAPYRPMPISALRETSPLAAASDATEVLAPDGVLMWPVGEDIYREWTSDDEDEPDDDEDDDPFGEDWGEEHPDDAQPAETVHAAGDVL